VLHVLWGGRIGGIETVVRDLAVEQLAGNEATPSVLFGLRANTFADELRSIGIDVVEAGMKSGSWTSPRAFVRVRRAAMDCDVIHLHSYSPSLALPLALSRRPIVFSEHGNFGQGRPVTVGERLKRRLQGRFMRRQVALTAANSRFTAEIAARRYRLVAGRLEVVHNGVSTAHLRDVAQTRGGRPQGVERALVVGGVARLVPWKRFDRLLRAAALAGPAVQRVLIVGGGPERDSLHSLAADLGIADRVEFTGPVSDVPDRLAQMDVFVLASEGEPFGMVILEALAAGLPVAVFADAGGPIEVLDDLGCGQVINDEAALAAIIRKAAAGGDLPKTCPLIRLEERFGISVMAGRFSALYRRALSEAEPGPVDSGVRS
jgi:glycosyltransferase involved in cell wall biosynthesis